MRHTGRAQVFIGVVAVTLVLVACSGVATVETPGTTGLASASGSPTTTAPEPTTVFGRVVDVARDETFRVVMRGEIITAGPATLVLDDGTSLSMPGYTEIQHACDLLTAEPLRATSHLSCHVIATVDETGTSHALRILMPDHLTEAELNGETEVDVAESDYAALALPTRRLVESSPERMVTEEGFDLTPVVGLDLRGCRDLTLEDLTGLPSEFQVLDRLILSGDDGAVIAAECLAIY